MNNYNFLLIFAVFHLSINAEKVRYDNYEVYRVVPKTREAVENLQFLETNPNYDFWSGVRGIGKPVDIMVPPQYKKTFADTFGVSTSYESKLSVANVQELIDKQKPVATAEYEDFDWTSYHTLESINAFLFEVAQQNPTQVEVLEVGKSYENRIIYGVRVSFSPDNRNRAIFIEANIHAREWITSAVATWILDQILNTEDDQIREVVQRYDWYIVPVFNPDGLAYTHTDDRLWRKTRTPYFFCVGVDPNRNWDYHFNEGGASPNPCSETYRGPEAFSETSTRTIADFIKTIGPQLEGYIALHSYGQLLMTPYGYTSEHLDNYDDLYNVGLKAAESLRTVHGTEYEVGNSVEILYAASGGSVDWVKGRFGTPISYVYELRDNGTFGFQLPPEQIIPTAEETFASLITILEEFNNLQISKNAASLKST